MMTLTISRSPCLLFLLLLLCALPAQAQLGETDAGLIARYGNALQYTSHSIVADGRTWKLGTSIIFKREGWEITGDLIGDRCARIRYTKGGEWSEADILRLLDLNRQEEAWTERSANPKVRREWVRPDGSTALWSKNGMTLTSAVYCEARAKAEENAETKRP